jgi:hypothetical protein
MTTSVSFEPPQHGGPGPRIYIPQEQGGPIIAPGTGFPFCRLSRLAGLRWRYSIPPHNGNTRVIKVKVTLRPTVSRPVRFGVRCPSWTRDKCFFLLENLFR